MSETSGGSYQRVTLSFPSPKFPTIDGATLYDPAGRRQNYRADETGALVPVHTCPLPDADEFEYREGHVREWRCPECSTVYDIRTEAWWERREETP